MRPKYEFTEDDKKKLDSAANGCGAIALITRNLRRSHRGGWTPEGASENWLAAGSAFKAAATGEYATIDLDNPSNWPYVNRLQLDRVLTPEFASKAVLEPVTEVIDRIRASGGWLPFPMRNRLKNGAWKLSAGINDLPSYRTIAGLGEIPREGGWNPVHEGAMALFGVENEFAPRIRDGLGHGVQTATRSARTATAALARRGEALTRRAGPRRKSR